MNFKKLLKRLTTKQESTGIFNLQNGFANAVYSQNYKHNSKYIYIANRFIADNVSTLKLKLNKSDGDEIDEHPFLKLIAKPNRMIDSSKFFYLISCYLHLNGNAYIFKNRTQAGEVKELLFLNPANVVPKKAKDGLISHYEYFSDSLRQLSADDIIHIYLPDPNNLTTGRSVVSGLEDFLDLDNLLSNRHLNVLKNQSIPSGILFVDGIFSQKNELLIRDKFTQFSSGSEAGEIVVISSGSNKDGKNKNNNYIPLPYNPRDLELLAGTKFTRDQIFEGFNISPILLGREQSANKSQTDAMREIFARNVLVPLYQNIANSLHCQLLNDFDESYQLTFESPIPEDKKIQADVLEQLTNKVITINEARSMMGLSSIPKGDNLIIGQGIASQFLSDMKTRTEEAKERYQNAKSTGKYLGKDKETGEDLFSYVSEGELNAESDY